MAVSGEASATRLAIKVRGGVDDGALVTIDREVVVGRGAADLVLGDKSLSRRHFKLTPSPDGAIVEDLESTNGLELNGTRVAAPMPVRAGDTLRAGRVAFEITLSAPAGTSSLVVEGRERRSSTVTVTRSPEVLDASPAASDLSPELLARDVWSDADVHHAGFPVVDADFVSAGGGIGSFVMVDYLRIAGVPADRVKVLTNLDYPWQTYEYLTSVSQVPPTERLRSDAASTPDNIWGFPSYAMRDVFAGRTPAEILAPAWNVLTEPVLCDFWTPTSGQVFRSLRREAGRIGYWNCVDNGLVRLVRRRHDGGYFTLLTKPHGANPRRVAYRSRHVHLAVGYPGVKFLEDLQDYRLEYRDTHHVVNAYEPHEHVYAELNRRPGRVIVRGSGIVSSRILQRLVDDRDHNTNNVEIVHLFRTYVGGAHGSSRFMRRRGGDGFAYQGFNWPKGTWGGQLKSRLERAEGRERAALLEVMGGTNTPYRHLWQRQLRRGRREGFYRTMVGKVASVEPRNGGGIVAHIVTDTGDRVDLDADFIIDATGLEADIGEHRLLKDLLDHGGAGRNPLNKLDVERTFEVRGTRSGSGRLYASGAATLGGYFAGVDTFLGLQYAALQITDDLAAEGFCARIGVGRSLRQWARWVRGVAP